MSQFRQGTPLLLVVAFALMAACSPPAPSQPAATTAAPKSAPAANVPPGWGTVVSEAKKEGTVVWHITTDSEANKAVAAAFEKEYGIKVAKSVIPAPDFLARIQAEAGANKVSTDVSTSGSARQWDEMGLGAPLGQLPVMLEPPDTWLVDPFKDVKDGRSQVPTPNIDPNYMLANPDSCPESNCPRSYKDLRSQVQGDAVAE